MPHPEDGLHDSEAKYTGWVLDCGFDPDKVGVVWDPSTGLGRIVRELRHRTFSVLATDTVQHDWDGFDGVQQFGEVNECDPSIRLICSRPAATDRHWFVRHALDLMDPNNGAVLLLLPHSFDAKSENRDLFEDAPFAAKLILSGMPDGAQALSWYYWDWNFPADQFTRTFWLPR